MTDNECDLSRSKGLFEGKIYAIIQVETSVALEQKCPKFDHLRKYLYSCQFL